MESEFTLQDVLEDAIEVEYNGERLIVVGRDFDDPDLKEYHPYISVIARSSIGDDLWYEYTISISELMDDPDLKVYHPTRVGFNRG